ncbi:MAG: pyruvate, phosphate dikinase [Candidatus Omnitrophica bacterium]|nr:pyruvate, phosphate dikinase [Candidatus Omnitrophota bacterium]
MKRRTATLAKPASASARTGRNGAQKQTSIYRFGGGRADGSAEMKKLLGGKGANLAEMTNLGVPVPPGFTITTDVCRQFYELGGRWPKGLEHELAQRLKWLEGVTKKGFGDPKNPLLVSVRSGAAVSMPGMMDTILNLGLNTQTVHGLVVKTENPRFVFDAYRRFIQMYGDVVLEVERKQFEEALGKHKATHGVKTDAELPAEALKALVADYKQIVKRAKGADFPEDPMEQLRGAINAVFSSWNNERAKIYRRLNNITGLAGTAVTVQSMVFGNMGKTSLTGVCFTRDPSTGENVFYGEYLVNAQGEDVVAGIRTPKPVAELKKEFPKLYDQLFKVGKRLEKYFKEVQDLEFTVEEGVLYMLQARTGKRTARAATTFATDFVNEGVISKEAALLRIDPAQIDQLLHPTIDPKAKLSVIAKGLPASPGAAVGKVVFHARRAVELAEAGSRVILVREETSPEDIEGMHAAQGILTSRGGITSHAAVVGRGMGKCCVVGCSEITVHEEESRFTVGDVVVKELDWITLNGTTGEVMLGEAPLVEPQLTGSFKQILDWADGIRRLKIRANADTPHDATVARDFGAEGIGLCRTEHMFFAEDRLPAVREMILAKNVAARKKALAKLLPFQRDDFKGIFEAMRGLPVTIRLLDPPLHEFLPATPEDQERVAKQLGIPVRQLADTVNTLHEINPMLGHRGCRLGLTYPEINEMQAQAIFEATCELARDGIKVIPEVMIPLVGHPNEFRVAKRTIDDVAKHTMERFQMTFTYLVGTMIEVPRAAVVADVIAHEAEFFSFGTNDLTQMTFGFSRDDIGKFLPHYLKEGILPADPFVKLDQEGVGELIKLGVRKGRATRKDLKVGICGEHGGEPSSIEFCHRLGFDYVSCSPYRVPVARLAAAQAVLREKHKG